MYIPLIKEKHSLVDLARYGTRSRKNIHPDVLVGTHPYPPTYKEGDLLDANATLNLVKNIYGLGNTYDALETLIKRNKELFEKRIDQIVGDAAHIDEVIAELEEKHDRDVEEIKEKQIQDVQDMKQYVAEEIDKATAIVAYDEFDENLLVYNVKHG